MKSKLKLLLVTLIVAIIVFLMFEAIKNFNTNNAPRIEPIIVGYAQLGSESAWRQANSESVKTAAEKAGVSLVFKNAEGAQEVQKQIIKDFIIQKVDVIIFPPLVATGWEDILAEAKRSNIPVIIADRTIEPNNTDLYSVFVGEDFMEEGKKTAQWLVNNTKSNKKLNIVELQGLAGSSPAVHRAIGFRSVIKKYPNISFIDSIPGDFIKARGKLGMQKLLKKHGKKINVVFAHNDDMALGAIEAIEEYGLKPGRDILIISVDGERAILQAIKDGKANMSAECTPLLGPTLMETAKKLHRGEKVPKKIVMQEKTFTTQNVNKELPLRTY